MSQYRKKPVVIEARQWDGTEDSAHKLIAWMGNGEYSPAERVNSQMFKPWMRIFTLEGEHIASPNDWIIKGVKGEFYPCKPDIFAATYEAADGAQDVARAPEGYVLVPVEQTERDKVIRDALIYGAGFMRDGKHIPPQAVIVSAAPAVPAVAPLAQALPFAILPDEMEALRRFHECVTDGEGYDVSKDMMKRLSKIGLLRRVTANLYEHTNFGLSVLNGDFDAAPAQAEQQGMCEHYDFKSSCQECRKAEQQGDGLRAAVRAVVSMLKNGEYAEYWAHFNAKGDSDAAALENAITDLVNRARDEPEEQQGDGGAVSKEWCMKMAALEPDGGVPPAGVAALAEQPSARVELSDEQLRALYRLAWLNSTWNSFADEARDFLSAQTGESKC